jgi:hypothetical protein
VWRYDQQCGYTHPRRLLLKTVTRGMPLGLAIAGTIITFETIYSKFFKKEDGHGSGHH